MTRIKSFAPIVFGSSRVLLLGSAPSVKSLAAGQYYAHPQNRFWRVMFALAEREFSFSYGERLKIAERLGIALWDVVGECEREGSGDDKIREVVPNPIPKLLEKYPSFERVAAVGALAAKMLKRHFPDLDFVRLPSTSPANAAKSFDDLVAAYRAVVIKN